jgi:hypothetical protein
MARAWALDDESRLVADAGRKEDPPRPGQWRRLYPILAVCPVHGTLNVHCAGALNGPRPAPPPLTDALRIITDIMLSQRSGTVGA